MNKEEIEELKIGVFGRGYVGKTAVFRFNFNIR
jgi:hypothetical protein